jgi:hypothetical protein
MAWSDTLRTNPGWRSRRTLSAFPADAFRCVLGRGTLLLVHASCSLCPTCNFSFRRSSVPKLKLRIILPPPSGSAPEAEGGEPYILPLPSWRLRGTNLVSNMLQYSPCRDGFARQVEFGACSFHTPSFVPPSYKKPPAQRLVPSLVRIRKEIYDPMCRISKFVTSCKMSDPNSDWCCSILSEHNITKYCHFHDACSLTQKETRWKPHMMQTVK